MEPAVATLIWSRSVERRKLCHTTFIGNGDDKSYQQVSTYLRALKRKYEDTSDNVISFVDPNSPSDTDESTSGISGGVCDICECK